MMDRRFPPGPVEGTPQGLAVHRHDPRHRRRQGGGPGEKALLERLLVERREDQAKLVVRRRAVGKGQETPQKVQLPLPEKRHPNPALGRTRNRAQRQQQNLVQRVENLRPLARVLKTRKMLQKIKAPAIPLVRHHHLLRCHGHVEPSKTLIFPLQRSFDCPDPPGPDA
jgi:hypothetical protein